MKALPLRALLLAAMLFPFLTAPAHAQWAPGGFS